MRAPPVLALALVNAVRALGTLALQTSSPPPPLCVCVCVLGRHDLSSNHDNRTPRKDRQESIGKFTASASGVLHVLLAPLNAARHAHRLIRRAGRAAYRSALAHVDRSVLNHHCPVTQTSVQSKGHRRSRASGAQAPHSDVLSTTFRGTSSFTRNI